MYKQRHRRRHHRRKRFARGRFFGRGEVRLALLGLLAERPRHGYELMKALEERSGGAYRASAGTIYPTLQMLEDEGLAAVQHENGKRVYRVTEEGRALLEEEQETVEEIWRRAEDWSDWGPFGLGDPDAAEVLKPALRLAKTAVRAVSREPDLADEVRAILRRARRDVQSLTKIG